MNAFYGRRSAHIKRVAGILLALILIVSLPVAALAADELDEILGAWQGSYVAGQGETGLTLTVYKSGDAYKALFEFYNLPGKTNAKEGSYFMNVSYDGGVYSFVGYEWIEKPDTYGFVDLKGTLSGKVLSGNSPFEFSVTKTGGWINASGWAQAELREAGQTGLIPKSLEGEDLTKPITRGEFAAVAVQLFEKWTSEKIAVPEATPFKDITGDKNYTEIMKAYALGITNGTSADTFSPSELITREQLATMLCRVYKAQKWTQWTLETDGNFALNYSGVSKFDDDADISDYARPSVYFMVKNSVITGVGNNLFAPRNVTPAQEAVNYATATREQSLLMSLRSFNKLG